MTEIMRGIRTCDVSYAHRQKHSAFHIACNILQHNTGKQMQ